VGSPILSDVQPVLDYLTANQPRFLDQLCDYLRFPSVSAQPVHQPDMERCAAWAVAACAGRCVRTRLLPTPGNPVILASTPRRPGRAHYLVYGHYDVQPPDPLELWTTPPFEPRIAGDNLFARGACDNKGQHFAHLKAVEAFLQTGTELPVDVTFLIEGEEEVGSDHLAPFLKEHREELACDGVVISDNGIPSLKHPALTYALRGVAAMEVKLTGPSRDLHSGLFGGSVDNPAMALCQMLGSLRDQRGRITIPGFYDDVVPLSAYERRQLKKLPFTEARYKKLLGVKQLFGERGFTPIEQKSARPTCEINGLTSGYQGVGSKTIVPSWASAKLTLRLVPDMKPAKIQRLVAAHLKKICPPTMRLQVDLGHAGEPYLTSPTGPQAQAAMRALSRAFGHEAVLMREGGSIPIVNDFKKILGADTLLLGLSLPDDNAHSPDEKMSLTCFRKGMAMSAMLWEELGRLS
jgi:acetylornithine deacetylase/succinyl-diaminopimelate desuccinylase-like protein